MSASEISFSLILDIFLLISIISLVRVLYVFHKVDRMKIYELRLIALLCYSDLLLEIVILLNIWFERLNLLFLETFFVLLSGSCFFISTTFAVIIAYVSHE
jgi:hypothetical protein